MAYIVPKELQEQYRALVQRANREIQKQLKYIHNHKITNPHTVRSMVSSFDDPLKWHGGRTPNSRSIKGRSLWDEKTEQMKEVPFKNENEFKAYVRFLDKWGNKTVPTKEGKKQKKAEEDYIKYRNFMNELGITPTEKSEYSNTHPETIKANYKGAIMKSLQEVAIKTLNLSLPNNKIPKEIEKELDSLTLTQITSFFNGGDPAEDVEIAQFSSDEFLMADNLQDFIDIAISRIHAIKKFN